MGLVREGLRMTAVLVLVMGALVAMLASLDAVAARVAGQPRGVLHFARVDEAERRLQTRLLLPGYFPDTLRWPPAAVHVLVGPPATVVVGVASRAGEGTQLLIGQSLADEPLSPEVWPPATEMSQSPVRIGEDPATLVRLLGADGEFWLETRFVLHGRRVALRSRGGVEELLRMARTMRQDR